jgi:hypothetical protein
MAQYPRALPWRRRTGRSGGGYLGAGTGARVRLVKVVWERPGASGHRDSRHCGWE